MRGSRLFPESARCDPSAPGRGRASRRIFRERHPELDRPLEQGRRALCRHGRLFSQRTQPVRAGRDVGQGGPFGLHVLPLHGRSGAQGDSLADREGPVEHGAAERQHQLRASREAARRARRRSVGTEVRAARLGPLLRSGRGRSGRAAGDDRSGRLHHRASGRAAQSADHVAGLESEPYRVEHAARTVHASLQPHGRKALPRFCPLYRLDRRLRRIRYFPSGI